MLSSRLVMEESANALALRLDRIMGIGPSAEPVTIGHGNMRAIAAAIKHMQKLFGGVDIEFYASQRGASHGMLGLLILFVAYPLSLSHSQTNTLMRWLVTVLPDERAKCSVYWGKSYDSVMAGLREKRYYEFERRIHMRFVPTPEPTNVRDEIKLRIQRASALVVIIGRMMKTVEGSGITSQTVMDVDWVFNYIGGEGLGARIMHGGGHFDTILQKLGANDETVGMVNSAISKLWTSASSTWTSFVSWARVGFERAKVSLNAWKDRSLKMFERMLVEGGSKLGEMGVKMKEEFEKRRGMVIEYYKREIAPSLKYTPEKAQNLKKMMKDFAVLIKKFFTNKFEQLKARKPTDAVLDTPANVAVSVSTDTRDDHSISFTGYSLDIMAKTISDLHVIADQTGNYVKGVGSANPVTVSMFLATAGALAEKYAKQSGFVMSDETKHVFQGFINGSDVGNTGINTIISNLKKIISKSEMENEDGTRRISFAKGINEANITAEEKRVLIDFLVWSRDFSRLAMEAAPTAPRRTVGSALDRELEEPGFEFSFAGGKLLNEDMVVFTTQLDSAWQFMIETMKTTSFDWKQHSLQEAHVCVFPSKTDSITSFSKVCMFMVSRLPAFWNIPKSRIGGYTRDSFEQDIFSDYSIIRAMFARENIRLVARIADTPGFVKQVYDIPTNATPEEIKAVLRFSKTFMNPRAILQSDTFGKLLKAVQKTVINDYRDVIRIPASRRSRGNVVPIETVVRMLVNAKRLPSDYSGRKEDIRYCLGVIARNINAFVDWANNIIKNDIGNFAKLTCDDDDCEHLFALETQLSLPHTIPILNKSGATQVMARSFASQASPGYFLITSIHED